MTVRPLRRGLALTTAAVGLSAVLSGCSIPIGLLTGDAQRDEPGNVKQDAKIDIFKLQVGDCKMADATGEVMDTAVVPCDKPHDEEVYFDFQLDDGDFPGEDAIMAEVEAQCVPAFEEYVGTAWEDSSLDIRWLEPTPDAWEQMDDRLVQCIVVDGSGAKLESSVKGARI